MKNRFHIFITFLLHGLFSYGQDEECRGINFHSIYGHDQFAVFADHLATADSSSVFVGSMPPSGLILKIKKNGVPAWSKIIIASNLSVSFYSTRELRDKNFLTIGLLTDPDLNRAIPQRLLLIKYDSSGQLIWQQALSIQPPKGILHSIDYPGIAENEEGSLFVCASVRSTSITTGFNYSLFARLSSTGSPQWSRLLETTQPLQLALPSQLGGKIDVFGNFALFDPASVPSNFNAGFVHFQFDLLSGALLKTNSVFIPIPPSDQFTSNFIYGFRAIRKTIDGFALSGTIPTKLGGSLQAVTLSYRSGFSDVLFLKTTLSNSNLYSKYICVDAKGKIAFVLGGGTTDAKMFYTEIDPSGNINKQKSIPFIQSNWSTNSVQQNLLSFKNDGLFSFGFPSTINGKSFLHHVQFEEAINPSMVSCMGVDTSGLVSTVSVMASSYALPLGTITSTILSGASGNITVKNAATYKEDICVSKAPPANWLNLGRDTVLCPGTSLKISAQKDYKNYLWQDGSIDRGFNVSAPGIYSLKAEDRCDNIYTDSISISYAATALNLQDQFSICKGESIRVTLPNGLKEYNWLPDLMTDSPAKNTTVFTPIVTSRYNLLAIDTAGCLLSDSLLFEVQECRNSFFVPTSFTPNLDGKNDLFKPSVVGNTISYQFDIYDRWGSRVFTTTDRLKGWDGKINGKTLATNVFVWSCSYQFANSVKEKKKGTVLLMR
jgi:gliding motility-associated-like protein